MGHSLNERRHDTRFSPPVTDGITVTLRPGNRVEIVDVCVRGARIHSRRPLHPGARIHLQLASSSRTVRLAAHVLRCSVSSLSSSGSVTYSGALRFDHRCELPWEERTHCEYQVPAVAHLDRGEEGQPIPATTALFETTHGRS
jgi:PilZ domain